MNAYRAALDNVKTLGGTALVKQEVALGQATRHAELGDTFQGFGGQTTEELAGAQGMGIGGLTENFGTRGDHRRVLVEGGGAVKLTKV